MKKNTLIQLETASVKDLAKLRTLTGHSSNGDAIAYALRLALASDTNHAEMSKQIDLELALEDIDEQRNQLLAQQAA